MIIFGSSLPPVVGRRAHVLFMLFVWFYFFIICIKQKSDRVSQSVYKYNNDMIPDSFRISGLSKSYSQYGGFICCPCKYDLKPYRSVMYFISVGIARSINY